MSPLVPPIDIQTHFSTAFTTFSYIAFFFKLPFQSTILNVRRGSSFFSSVVQSSSPSWIQYSCYGAIIIRLFFSYYRLYFRPTVYALYNKNPLTFLLLI